MSYQDSEPEGEGMIELQFVEDEFSEIHILAYGDTIQELEDRYPQYLGNPQYEVCDENFRCKF